MQWRTQEFFFGRGGCSTNSVEDRGQGSGGGSPLVRGSGGSCDFVQEISFHIVKSCSFFGTLSLFMMTIKLFVIANVKQLRTDSRFRILLPFVQISWRVCVLNSEIFKSFRNRVGTILEGLRNFGGAFEPRKPSPLLCTPLL